MAEEEEPPRWFKKYLESQMSNADSSNASEEAKRPKPSGSNPQPQKKPRPYCDTDSEAEFDQNLVIYLSMMFVTIKMNQIMTLKILRQIFLIRIIIIMILTPKEKSQLMKTWWKCYIKYQTGMLAPPLGNLFPKQ